MRSLVLGYHRAALLALVLVTAAVLAGCGNGGVSHAAHAQGARMVATGNTLNQRLPAAAADAPLVDQDGRPLTLAALAGKMVVIAPFLTMCQETCPLTSANIRRAVASAGALGHQTVFLEVTVDPARDSVRRIHAYQAEYGALPNWRLATGSPTAVKAFWGALGVSLEKAPGDGPVRDWLTGKTLKSSYDVHHQDLVMVLDASGRIRWITLGRPDARGLPLPTTLEHFLDDEGRSNRAHPGAGGASTWTARDVEQALSYVHHLAGKA